MNRKKDSVSEDLEWVRRSKNGDQEAFSELVRRYRRRAYCLAYGMLGNREDALDITQEAFYKAFRSLQGFRGGGGFYTWFYRIVYNLAIDFRRREWRKKNMEYEDGRDHTEASVFEASPSLSSNPARDAARKELNSMIMGAIQSLSKEHRAVILLREVEGFSYDEIARTLRVRKGTVMSRLHYARQRLQEILTPYIKEGEIGGKE